MWSWLTNQAEKEQLLGWLVLYQGREGPLREMGADQVVRYLEERKEDVANVGAYLKVLSE